MAKKATGKKGGTPTKSKKSSGKKRAAAGTRSRKSDAGDAFISLLQSPLVTDLVAVAATSALAALAAHRGQDSGKGAGQAVKKAGKAAADAVKRRLTEEVDAIKQASKAAKDGKATKA
jgi:hypothetical protein